MRAMDINFHIAMYQGLDVGHDSVANRNAVLGGTALLDRSLNDVMLRRLARLNRALNDMGIDMVDAAMAGPVHRDGFGGLRA
jgi:hypothetical protein